MLPSRSITLKFGLAVVGLAFVVALQILKILFPGGSDISQATWVETTTQTISIKSNQTTSINAQQTTHSEEFSKKPSDSRVALMANTGNGATQDNKCQLVDKNANNLFQYEFYRQVHNATFPACASGQWMYQPDRALFPSPKHLQCLDQERQGNCHDPKAWINSTDPAKKTRHNSQLNNAVLNSPGILNASDPWVWQSDLDPYKVIPYEKEEYPERIRKILFNRTVYLIGDSLTRQWSQVMLCEAIHVLGVSNQVAKTTVKFLPMHVGFDKKHRHGHLFQDATERDYVVFNFGHHVGNKLGEGWPQKYSALLESAHAVDFGKIPDRQIFFRTTTVRHFLRNMGDWNTGTSKSGAIIPDLQATWDLFGGNTPEQPRQNLIALDVLLNGNHGRGRENTTNDKSNNLVAHRRFRILDTSPMMLARADASFDGSHFCLPGPMDFWSRMLYYQMEQDDKK